MRGILLPVASIAIGGMAAAGEMGGERDRDLLGAWNIRIFDTGDGQPTFASSWWKVERADGGLRASMVWRWGGVSAIDRAEIAGGELRLTRREGNRDVLYRAKRIGDELLGFVERDGAKGQYFVGRRAPELAGVAGTWKFSVEGEGEGGAAYLVLDESDGRIGGRAIAPDGQTYPIVRAGRRGTRIQLGARVPGSDAILRAEGEVRGDRMALKVASPDGEAIELRGERERAWGDPIVLFDGASLAGWKARDPSKTFGWRVEDGAMVNRPPDVDIVSEKSFRDFRLHIEFNVDPNANSGIYLRGRYELQILDDHGKGVQAHGNGAVYGRIAPAKNASRPAGEWQTAEIVLVGRWLTVDLNGERIIDNECLEGITGGALDPWEGDPGPILLQGDHGRVRFRNIAVRPAS